MCINIAPDQTQEFMGKFVLISTWNAFCSIPSGKFVFKGKAMRCKKFNLWNFWEHPLVEIWEYDFKVALDNYNIIPQLFPKKVSI